MRAVVFEGPGARPAWPRFPNPSVAGAGRRDRAGHAHGDLRQRPALPPRQGADRARRRPRARGGRRGGGGRRGRPAVRPGDRVVVAFDIACGACWFCERGQTALCEDFRNLGAGAFGGGLPGAQAERVRIPRRGREPAGGPRRGRGRARAVRRRRLDDRVCTPPASRRSGPGTSVAVIGVGPVGFFAIQAARARGASGCSRWTVRRRRLALAPPPAPSRSTPPRVHAPMAAGGATGGRGADVVIEAVGTPEAYETAVETVRRGGERRRRGHVRGRVGRAPARGVLGARRSRPVRRICPVHAWWERAMRTLRAGRLDPGPLISHRCRWPRPRRGTRCSIAGRPRRSC